LANVKALSHQKWHE